MASSCGNDQIFNGLFLEFAISLPLIILCQIALLSRTVYHEYTHKHRANSTQISLQLRCCYIFIQLAGLYWTLIDLLRFIIDPFTLTLRDNISCQIAGYSPKVIPTFFYGFYLYQILLRLRNSFKGSFLALNDWMFKFLAVLIFTFLTVAPMFLFVFNDRTSVCIYTWYPSDSTALLTDSTLSFCGIILGSATYPVTVAGYTFVAVMNIVFGIMFSMKLKRLMAGSDGCSDKQIKWKFKRLILKNSILTVVGATSTVLSWALWMTNILGVGAVFVYIDLFLNCCMIALMFQYNERYFKLCCRCCIVCCFRRCGKEKTETEMAKLQDYIDQDTQLSTTDRDGSTPGTPKVTELPLEEATSAQSDVHWQSPQDESIDEVP